MQTARVLIAEDHPITRLGLESLLEREPRIEVVGSASDGRDVLDLVGTLSPDILLLDVELPGLNGYQVAVQVVRNLPQVRILVLTAHEDRALVAFMLRLGVSGFLLKSEDFNQIVRAIHGIMEGKKGWVSRCIMEQVSTLLVDRRNDRPSFTWRETQILKKIAQGKTNSQIALEMHISVKLVEKHMRKILQKLETDSRVEAVVFAVQEGLI